MPNLVDWIEHQMARDDEDRGKQSYRLRVVYEESGPAERKALDDAMICICGYSLETPRASALRRVRNSAADPRSRLGLRRPFP